MAEPKKILMIDDDPTLAQLVGLLVAEFRRGPFILEYASDYAGGLKCLLSGEYSLCLLDYQLGSRDGLDLLREAKAARCPTPIIFLTGQGREETDMLAMDCGAADFLEKAQLTMRGLERAVCYALETAGALAQLRDAATHDELTGVSNRREFDRRLQEEWERSQSHQRPLSLVMIDLDHFKQINDAHGHQAGDSLLRYVADELAGHVREGDCLARYGGDEFSLIMVEIDSQGARAAATRLHTLLCSKFWRVPAKGLSINVEVSVGVATWPADASSLAELISAADAALYAAKRQGRNQVRPANAHS